MLIRNNQLNTEQMQSLMELMQLCRQHDESLPAIYPHLLEKERPSENNLLYYQGNTLIGFLSVYYFYEEACEVSLLIDPHCRRQGVGKKLLLALLPDLVARKLKKVIFSAPPSKSHQWLTDNNAHYMHTEYHMQRQGFEPVLMHHAAMEIRKIKEEDIATLCEIDQACFPDSHENMHERFINLLNDSQYTLYIGVANHRPVGKAHIRWQKGNQALFSDIAILPEFQGRGLGGELLAFCINEALTQNHANMALDVETKNSKALNLYTRYGFKVAQQHEFWFITLEDLRQQIPLSETASF